MGGPCAQTGILVRAEIFWVKNMLFFDRKMRKTGITLQNSRNPPMGRNFAWLTSERRSLGL